MKILKMLVLIIIAISALAVSAQGTAIEFEAFENETFGISGIAPSGWQNVAPGAYARGLTPGDLTTFVVQSAPLTTESLLSALTVQLGIEAFPEPEGEIETEAAIWTLYRVDATTAAVTVSLAITYVDNVSYIVVMQSFPEEHDALREAVFMPGLEAVRIMIAVEDIETEDLPYIVEEVSFESGDITLAGTLTIPEGEGEFPAVVLVSGSGAHNRNESLEPLAEIEPFREIADYLTRNGVAVLRYDDRGTAQSEGDFAASDMVDFRDDANAAINYLAERGEFTHIGVAGHSEGGTYAPEIGVTNDNVDFVVSLAGATMRVIEVLPAQLHDLSVAEGMEEEQALAIQNAMLAVIEAYDSGDDEAFDAALSALVEAQYGEEPSEQILALIRAQMTSPVYISYFDYNPTPFWLALDKPTLAIYGTLDLQVRADLNTAVIEGQNDNITIVTIENMNHLFQAAETGATSEYGTLEQHVMPELLETLKDWILMVTAQ